MRRYAFAVLASIAGVAAVVVACGSDDDVTSTPVPDAGSKVDGKASTSSSSGTLPPDSGPGLFEEKDQLACEGRVANDAFAVFVTPTGEDVANCGNREAPCKTVSNAIKTAYALAKPKVLIGAGTYREAIELPGGLVLEGGWTVSGTTWSASCGADHSTLATIESTTNIGVKATVGASVLRFLSVKSKAAAAPGESLYGLVVQGPNVRVALDDANLIVAAGGAGGAGAAGDGAETPGACDGGADDAGMGDSGSPGGDASIPSFGGAGIFNPGNGADGTNGVPGKNGASATAPSAILTSKCEAAGPVCVISPYSVTPKTGAPGCGGGGGKGGKAGNGGGASVGIVAIDAIVATYKATITTGAGGAGGNGGTGADGAAGAAGVPGSSTDYAKTPTTGCTAAMPCANDTASLDGGAGGGAGGKGGTGGNGSGGSGGWSIGFVKFGSAALLEGTGTSFKNGGGGKGGAPSGADGLGQQQWP